MTGSIITAGDLSERTSSRSWTVDSVVDGGNAIGRLFEPQLSPKAEWTDSATITLEWASPQDITFVALWGIDTDSQVDLRVDEGVLSGGAPRQGRLLKGGISGSEVLVYFMESAVLASTITIEITGAAQAGYLQIGRHIQHEDLISGGWSEQPRDTGLVEESEGGQQYSQLGSNRRAVTLSVESGESLFYGLPEVGDNNTAIGVEPVFSGDAMFSWTENSPKAGGDQRWRVNLQKGDVAIATWPDIITSSETWLVEYSMLSEQRNSRFSATLASSPIYNGEGWVQSQAPSHPRDLVLQISSLATAQHVDFELISCRPVKQPAVARSLDTLRRDFGETAPIGLFIRPSSPVWSRPLSLIGYAKWGKLENIDRSASLFRQSLELVESL